ncbi:MAG: LytTR family transcriptional regulator [Lachnospiraceae bacterium]|nr:LytTR family transcriptional regulator [Lachnospiraceae bacterium]
MKVKIEIASGVSEPEVLIRCERLDESVIALQNYILEQSHSSQVFMLRQGETEYYIPVKDILFFETEGRMIAAHTKDKLFEAEYKLYELEELLPPSFMRISKSTIVNMDYIYSITRNLTASSVIEFNGSKKTVLVSRGYYKALTERLNTRKGIGDLR